MRSTVKSVFLLAYMMLYILNSLGSPHNAMHSPIYSSSYIRSSVKNYNDKYCTYCIFVIYATYILVLYFLRYVWCCTWVLRSIQFFKPAAMHSLAVSRGQNWHECCQWLSRIFGLSISFLPTPVRWWTSEIIDSGIDTVVYSNIVSYVLYCWMIDDILWLNWQ